MIGLFDKMGGQEGIRSLVDCFYDTMDIRPDVKVIRNLHAKNLSRSREKLYEFLVGWSGGPQLYVEKYGHPRLRMRHLPFPIGEDEREQWMSCMEDALLQSDYKEEVRKFLLEKFYQIADFMRNKE